MPDTFIHHLARLIALCLLMFVISTPQAADTSLATLEKQAASGDMEAQLALADRYYKGDGVTKNTAKAAHWYQELAKKDFVQAQLTLGLMHIKGDGVARDDKKAMHWLTQAAENKSPAAQHLLGVAYAEGHGVTADPIKAYMWFEIAAVMEYPNAVASRRELAGKMKLNDIKRAEQMASEWWLQHHQ